MTMLLVEDEIEVRPVGIHLFDQSDLPIPAPLLEALLSRNRLIDALVSFVPDEPLDIVLCGESRNDFGFVFMDAPGQIVGDAKIKRSMPTTCQEIDVVSYAASVDTVANVT
jgi:hypothetical protein